MFYGKCEQNKRELTRGLYKMIPDFCPAVARIAWRFPGTFKSGSDSFLGILHGCK